MRRDAYGSGERQENGSRAAVALLTAFLIAATVLAALLLLLPVDWLSG